MSLAVERPDSAEEGTDGFANDLRAKDAGKSGFPLESVVNTEELRAVLSRRVHSILGLLPPFGRAGEGLGATAFTFCSCGISSTSFAEAKRLGAVALIGHRYVSLQTQGFCCVRSTKYVRREDVLKRAQLTYPTSTKDPHALKPSPALPKGGSELRC